MLELKINIYKMKNNNIKDALNLLLLANLSKIIQFSGMYLHAYVSAWKPYFQIETKITITYR